jgi:hypothetical protein
LGWLIFEVPFAFNSWLFVCGLFELSFLKPIFSC